MEQVLKKSEGVFLYVRRFCDDVQRGHLSLEHPEQFPQGLGGMFYQFFQRQFPQRKKDADFHGFNLADYKERCRPLLEMVVAAQEPPRLKFLYRALGWNKYDEKEVVDAFGSLMSVTGGRIQMFHKSVVDWLCDSQRSGVFFVDADAGHRRLADRCWLEFNSSTERVSWYSRLYFQVHLNRTGEVEKRQIIEKRLRSSVETVRVYVSSTFRDMPAERDILVKQVFPQLRKLCRSRGVTWGEVDLRWGITSEEAAEGKVIGIALEEVRRCKPFFIGILGERYGWVPDRLPAELIEIHLWLREFPNASVNELEIVQGVLSDTETLGYGLMYFRDPQFVDQLPASVRRDFESESASSRSKLDLLKQRIRKAADEEVCLLRENYSNPGELARWILDDFGRLLNTFLPDISVVDPLDQEAKRHEAYAQTRESVYIGRREYFDRLDTHAAVNDTPPLVILGESGSGKSALLANWSARYRRSHPDVFVFQHYIGATPYSADCAAMLRRLVGELKRRLIILQDIPDQPDALRTAFPNWLYMAAAKGRIVLVLDALNQLEDMDGGPDLVWLPPVLPENVRLLVSTLPGRSLDEIQRRKWPSFKVELLSADERRRLIAEYLAQYAKRLNVQSVERIAIAPQSANPLYLRVLLDELRLVCTHGELEGRIGDYLKAESPSALYEKVIARWEQDYEPTLVRQSLMLIWASRAGISEVELLDLLGRYGKPLPHSSWSPFYRAAESILIDRSGLLSFSSTFAREAVWARYLSTHAAREKAHYQLEQYFVQQQPSARIRDELNWQRDQQRKGDMRAS